MKKMMMKMIKEKKKVIQLGIKIKLKMNILKYLIIMTTIMKIMITTMIMKKRTKNLKKQKIQMMSIEI